MMFRTWKPRERDGRGLFLYNISKSVSRAKVRAGLLGCIVVYQYLIKSPSMRRLKDKTTASTKRLGIGDDGKALIDSWTAA